MIGVECDGATYHRSATARDRDKVREEILIRLGWNLLRLWSTDFWVDSEGELDRLGREIQCILDADRALKEATEEEHLISSVYQEEAGEVPVTSDMIHASRDEDFRQEPLLVRPVKTQNDTYRIFTFEECEYQLNPDLFYDAGYTDTLEKLIQAIVDVETPIRDDALACRVARVHGFKRTGKHILEVVSRVVQKRHKLISEGEYTFVWPAEASPADWNLARLPTDENSLRPVDEISNAELMAFEMVYRTSIDPVEDIKHALGFSRLKRPAKERITRAVESIKEHNEPNEETN